MAIQSAESSKAKRAPKALSHLEIHPRLGGGHVVKHVYTGYEHPSKEYQFNKAGVAKGGEQITSHLTKHAGLPGGAAEAEGEDSAVSE